MTGDVLDALFAVLQALMPLVYLAVGIFVTLCVAVGVTIYALLVARIGMPRV